MGNAVAESMQTLFSKLKVGNDWFMEKFDGAISDLEQVDFGTKVIGFFKGLIFLWLYLYVVSLGVAVLAIPVVFAFWMSKYVGGTVVALMTISIACLYTFAAYTMYNVKKEVYTQRCKPMDSDDIKYLENLKYLFAFHAIPLLLNLFGVLKSMDSYGVLGLMYLVDLLLLLYISKNIYLIFLALVAALFGIITVCYSGFSGIFYVTIGYYIILLFILVKIIMNFKNILRVFREYRLVCLWIVLFEVVMYGLLEVFIYSFRSPLFLFAGLVIIAFGYFSIMFSVYDEYIRGKSVKQYFFVFSTIPVIWGSVAAAFITADSLAGKNNNLRDDYEEDKTEGTYSSWVCHKCGKVNGKEIAACTICGAERSEAMAVANASKDNLSVDKYVENAEELAHKAASKLKDIPVDKYVENAGELAHKAADKLKDIPVDKYVEDAGDLAYKAKEKVKDISVNEYKEKIHDFASGFSKKSIAIIAGSLVLGLIGGFVYGNFIAIPGERFEAFDTKSLTKDVTMGTATHVKYVGRIHYDGTKVYDRPSDFSGSVIATLNKNAEPEHLGVVASLDKDSLQAIVLRDTKISRVFSRSYIVPAGTEVTLVGYNDYTGEYMATTVIDGKTRNITLNYGEMKLPYRGDWVKVRMNDGKEGYVYNGSISNSYLN